MKQRLAAATLLGLALPAAALEAASTMQSPAERLSERPAGPWQGDWRVERLDPRLHSRAGAEALRLQVIDDGGRLDLDWQVGRGLCDPPEAEPCEWVGATGAASLALTSADALLAVLPVSADEADPWLLHLSPPQAAGPAQGHLFQLRGGSRYAVEARRLPDPP